MVVPYWCFCLVFYVGILLSVFYFVLLFLTLFSCTPLLLLSFLCFFHLMLGSGCCSLSVFLPRIFWWYSIVNVLFRFVISLFLGFLYPTLYYSLSCVFFHLYVFFFFPFGIIILLLFLLRFPSFQCFHLLSFTWLSWFAFMFGWIFVFPL